jgi:hypothetical protein
MKKAPPKLLYNSQPCDRCGSEKITSKTWNEEIKTALGVSIIEVSQTVCTNKACQAKFDKIRQAEMEVANNRKLAKEEQIKNRKESIAKTIAERHILKKQSP